MALFSFRHSVKTFSPKCESASRIAQTGQTAAHLRYITRPAAAGAVIRQRLDHTTDTRQAQAAEQAAQGRRGRVCERFIVALPVEASREQRLELAQAFAEALTQEKAGYILAIHDKAGNDQRNPHFHLVAFDKHEKTGGRGRPRSILGMARKNAVETWAKRWADIHNSKMNEWGFGPESSITHLSFEERGINRVPEIHEGPASRAMMDRGQAANSKSEWKHIDAGNTRAEANITIRQINQLNEEIENDTGSRLGSRDRRNQAQGDSSRPTFGKDGGRRCAVPFGTVEPTENPFPPRQEPSRNQQPPWIVGERPKKLGHPSRGPQQREGQRYSGSAFERPAGLPGGRRRVRRVFLELIFLRETLRARLATLKGRRQRLYENSASQDKQRSSIYTSAESSQCETEVANDCITSGRPHSFGLER